MKHYAFLAILVVPVFCYSLSSASPLMEGLGAKQVKKIEVTPKAVDLNEDGVYDQLVISLSIWFESVFGYEISDLLHYDFELVDAEGQIIWQLSSGVPQQSPLTSVSVLAQCRGRYGVVSSRYPPDLTPRNAGHFPRLKIERRGYGTAQIVIDGRRLNQSRFRGPLRFRINKPLNREFAIEGYLPSEFSVPSVEIVDIKPLRTTAAKADSRFVQSIELPLELMQSASGNDYSICALLKKDNKIVAARRFAVPGVSESIGSIAQRMVFRSTELLGGGQFEGVDSCELAVYEDVAAAETPLLVAYYSKNFDAALSDTRLLPAPIKYFTVKDFKVDSSVQDDGALGKLRISFSASTILSRQEVTLKAELIHCNVKLRDVVTGFVSSEPKVFSMDFEIRDLGHRGRGKGRAGDGAANKNDFLLKLKLLPKGETYSIYKWKHDFSVDSANPISAARFKTEDRAVDMDGDGKVDHLEIRTLVPALKTGDYVINGLLLDEASSASEGLFLNRRQHFNESQKWQWFSLYASFDDLFKKLPAARRFKLKNRYYYHAIGRKKRGYSQTLPPYTTADYGSVVSD